MNSFNKGKKSNTAVSVPNKVAIVNMKHLESTMKSNDSDIEKGGSGKMKSVKIEVEGGLPEKTKSWGKGDNSSAGDGDSISQKSIRMLGDWMTSTRMIVFLIMFLGSGTSILFLGVGIKSARDTQRDDFDRDGFDLVKKIQAVWEDYVNAASIVHARCRDRSFTRADFRDLYEYIVATGLEFKAVQFDPFVTREERPAYEAEARAYYAENYPDYDYPGFRGFEPGIPGLSPRSEQDFYYPIHYQEPIPGNEAAIDLDYYSHASRRESVNHILTHGEPAVTGRLLLVKSPNAINRCTPDDSDAYGVVLMHPGVNLTAQADKWPHEFSSIVTCIPQLLLRATLDQGDSAAVYIHDSTEAVYGTIDEETGELYEPDYLGGLRVEASSKAFVDDEARRTGKINTPTRTIIGEITLTDLIKQTTTFIHQEEIAVANRYWIITVVALEGDYKPNVIFVALGGGIIFVAAVCLALWVYTNTRRLASLNQLKAQAEADKALLILDNARQATRAERELNDFIAHEVRNPVAAAMAATSFVKTALMKDPPLTDEDAIENTREDVSVIDNALKFVNDLLRNMLDMHRAADKQLNVTKAPTDLLADVLEPVQAMLYQRGERVDVMVDCPEHLIVMTDTLRLKQIVLNLGRNSSKFVHQGFIRLKAEEVETGVRIFIDDSGPGIPEEKRKRLFAKFQESLDRLSQGTGIGLFLCKNLIELMGGEIRLDDDYVSGIPGCPGTRLIVDLRTPSIDPVELLKDSHNHKEHGERGHPTSHLHGNRRPSGNISTSTPTENTSDGSQPDTSHMELPKKFNVLLVDDDAIIRKLFARSIKIVAPEWTFREASNGEAAVRLCASTLTDENGEHIELNSELAELLPAPPTTDTDGKATGPNTDCKSTFMVPTNKSSKNNPFMSSKPSSNNEPFDLIFVDMYMASVEKQMLGTETVAAMRDIGVKSHICGLSANDTELEFLEAGADCFTFKPFPCQPDQLRAELLRLLYA